MLGRWKRKSRRDCTQLDGFSLGVGMRKFSVLVAMVIVAYFTGDASACGRRKQSCGQVVVSTNSGTPVTNGVTVIPNTVFQRPALVSIPPSSTVIVPSCSGSNCPATRSFGR